MYRALRGTSIQMQTLELIQSADWVTISKRLLAFTLWWAEKYSWRSGTKLILPKGFQPEDIVEEIILKTIEGKRKFDPEKGELEPWLRDQIKSEVNNLYNIKEHSLSTHIPQDIDDSPLNEEIHSTQFPNREDSSQLSPENILIEKESQIDYSKEIKRKYDSLFEAANEDSELVDVIDAIIDGCQPKPRYLADKLQTSVPDINNRLKRLRRIAIKIKEQNNG